MSCAGQGFTVEGQSFRGFSNSLRQERGRAALTSWKKSESCVHVLHRSAISTSRKKKKTCQKLTIKCATAAKGKDQDSRTAVQE